MRKQKHFNRNKQVVSPTLRPQGPKSNDNNKIITELTLQFEAATRNFDNATQSINVAAARLHARNKVVFPYIHQKQNRYWFMPFTVKDAYNRTDFPQAFHKDH